MERTKMWSVLFFLGFILFVKAQSGPGYAECTVGKTCINGGSCVRDEGSGVEWCMCQPDWTGESCESQATSGSSVCPSGKMCQNGGSCFTEADGTDNCYCSYEWTGTYCETPNTGTGFSDCITMSCYNGGSCMVDPSTGSEYCMCQPGWSGSMCEMGSDMTGPCEADTCHNGGSCYSNDYPSSWWCNCPPGRSGMFCEIEMPDTTGSCASEGDGQCNDGTCSDDDIHHWWCNCPPQKTGTLCETTLPDMTGSCVSPSSSEILSQCTNNGGNCSDYGGNWWCNCPHTRTGYLCETDMPDTTGTCETMVSDGYSCLNGGNCSDSSYYASGTTTHYCMCTMGWTGNHCEYDDAYGGGSSGGGGGGWGCMYNMGRCQSEGRQCVDDDSESQGFRCCPAGFMGENCETEDTGYDYCFYNAGVCQNGGTCQRRPRGSFKCDCQLNYYGEKCEEDPITVLTESHSNTRCLATRECEVNDLGHETGPDTLKLEVDGCEKLHEMAEGITKRVDEYCSGSDVPFFVRCAGMQAGTEYVVQVIKNYNGDELAPGDGTTFTYTGGSADITEHFAPMMVTGPDPTRNADDRRVCNNDDIMLSLRIQTTSETDKVMNETDPLSVRVVCDPTDVNVALSTANGNALLSLLDVSYHDPSTAAAPLTLGSALQEAGFSDSFAISASDDFPLLGNDATYYAVVFLTKRPVTPPDSCPYSADLEPPVPDISVGDDILEIIPYADPFESDPSKFDIDTTLKAVELFQGREKCGQYYLVILLDALRSTRNESDRCDNYLVVQVQYRECAGEEEGPTCMVIPNPYENGYDSAIIFKDMHATIFKHDNYQQWREEDTGEYGSNQERIYNVMDKGYPRLKILWKEAMDRIEREPSLLGELNAEAVKEMEEGLAQEQDDAMDTVDTFVNEYKEALTKVGELKSGSKTPDTVRADAEAFAESITDATNIDETSMFRNGMNKKAFHALVNISKALKDGEENHYKEKARAELCRVGDKIATLVQLKQMLEGNRYMETMYPTALDPYRQTIKGLVGNLTTSMINLEYFYSDARFYGCLNQKFTRAVNYLIGNMDLNDDSWVFEKKCGAKYDSCFRKVTALCSTHDDECRNATNFTEDKELAAMRLVHKQLDAQGRALGLFDLRDGLREYTSNRNDEGRKGNCNGEEHVTAKPGPVQLYKMDDTGVIHYGVPHVNKNNDMICWRPIGVCTCEDCPGSTGSGSWSDSGSWGGGGSWSDPYSSGSGSGYRRKKK